jgi:hypothetical protein
MIRNNLSSYVFLTIIICHINLSLGQNSFICDEVVNEIRKHQKHAKTVTLIEVDTQKRDQVKPKRERKILWKPRSPD